MVKNKAIISKNEKDTERIAGEFVDKILNANKKTKKATVFGLVGDLGAGKTTFVKSLAKKLGIKAKLNSPTFVIMKRYPLTPKGKYKHMFHLDAYRLKNEHELHALGWEAVIANPEHLIFIEWPENVGKAMPKATKYIHISHGEDKERHFLLP